MTARPREAPLLDLGEEVRFNLRAITDYSPTAALATPEERAALGSFMGRYGVELPPAQAGEGPAGPMARLRAFLARNRGVCASRFSDGSFPVVYMGDAPETCLAEVSHYLGRALGETAAAKIKPHYFLLARFVLVGTTLDVRNGFPRLHLPDDWAPARAFGGQASAAGRHGITFRSIRRRKAENMAVLRRELVRSGTRIQMIALRWDGAAVVRI